ncbi:hypothetical protein C7S18_04525 [Ahniella affigens]|uniref:Uncharacterized protein n=1 Tax=Ahniella affigens TaxID=2021234 RepID=A0A2P1PNV6_9GAMM|nr:hypothetical protein C7S18_04525 [Ahniella affigens]
MKALAEPIARQSKKEDGCTGRFCEARSNAQAPLPEQPFGVVAAIKQEGSSRSSQSQLNLANFTCRHRHQG